MLGIVVYALAVSAVEVAATLGLGREVVDREAVSRDLVSSMGHLVACTLLILPRADSSQPIGPGCAGTEVRL